VVRGATSLLRVGEGRSGPSNNATWQAEAEDATGQNRGDGEEHGGQRGAGGILSGHELRGDRFAGGSFGNGTVPLLVLRQGFHRACDQASQMLCGPAGNIGVD